MAEQVAPREKPTVTEAPSLAYWVEADGATHLVTVLLAQELPDGGRLGPRAYCNCGEPGCSHRMDAMAVHRGLPA